MTVLSNGLEAVQVRQYEKRGFLFPLPALTPLEVSTFRTAFEELEHRFGGHLPPARVIQPQLHFRWAYNLTIHPAILDIVSCVIGANILVHSTTIFCKYPHDRAYVPWHQDGYYWGLSAPKVVSAWVALSDSHSANGCMRILPSTHNRTRAHIERHHPHNMLFSTGSTVQEAVDESQAVDVVLRAGEMSLHHVDAIHGSQPNVSDEKRIGFAIRYAAADIHQALPHHAVILARGQMTRNTYSLLQTAPPDDIEAALSVQARFVQNMSQQRRSKYPTPGSPSS